MDTQNSSLVSPGSGRLLCSPASESPTAALFSADVPFREDRSWVLEEQLSPWQQHQSRLVWLRESSALGTGEEQWVWSKIDNTFE